MKKILFILSFISSSILFGQNLVVNGSFENVSTIPNNPGQLNYAIGWTEFRDTPDLYSALSPSPSMQVPNVAGGYQQPFHGDNYVGFFAYHTTSNGREYLGTTLSSPLVVGKNYSISMYVSLAAIDSNIFMTLAVSNIGAVFTNTLYSFANPYPILNNAHAYSLSVIGDTSATWVNIQGTFVADSAYQFLAIGNFFNDANTTVVNYFPLSPFNYSYYFVDSVSVHEIPLTGIAEQTKHLINISPNPASTSFIINGLNKVYTLNIYNAVGQLLYQEDNILASDKRVDVSQYPKGLFFIKIESEGEVYTYKILKQ